MTLAHYRELVLELEQARDRAVLEEDRLTALLDACWQELSDDEQDAYEHERRTLLYPHLGDEAVDDLGAVLHWAVPDPHDVT